MKVLETLKGKLNSVQQDISSSFKSLRTKSKRIRITSKTEGINLDAGADLLNKYHESWVAICRATEENAKKAAGVDGEISKLYHQIEKQSEGMNQLMTLVSNLPKLLVNITELTDKLKALDVDLDEVESKLIHLEDVCEQHDMTSNKFQHEYQLSLYRQRKNVELEQVKLKLAKDHAVKVQGYESKLQDILKRRQQVFEQEFSQQMANYKKYGHTQIKPTNEVKQQLDIADISLEQDVSELDDFLKSDEQIPPEEQAGYKDSTDTEDENGTVSEPLPRVIDILPDDDIEEISSTLGKNDDVLEDKVGIQKFDMKENSNQDSIKDINK